MSVYRVYKSCVSLCCCATSSTMGRLYLEHRDDDGFLYVAYSGENTFGRSTFSVTYQSAPLHQHLMTTTTTTTTTATRTTATTTTTHTTTTTATLILLLQQSDGDELMIESRWSNDNCCVHNQLQIDRDRSSPVKKNAQIFLVIVGVVILFSSAQSAADHALLTVNKLRHQHRWAWLSQIFSDVSEQIWILLWMSP